MDDRLTAPPFGPAPEPALPLEIIAGPPGASPPLPIALMLVALSIAGPFIFVAYGTPSLLLGITAVAVALAGMITMIAAVRAQLRRRADATARRRVTLSSAGVTLHPTRASSDDQHFPWEQIVSAHLAQSTFFLQAALPAPNPGRHAIRFGKLVTPRRDIISVLNAYQPKPGIPDA